MTYIQTYSMYMYIYSTAIYIYIYIYTSHIYIYTHTHTYSHICYHVWNERRDMLQKRWMNYRSTTDVMICCIIWCTLITPIELQICKDKAGKAVPLQAWSGPEGSRNLWFPDFMTTAQDGGKVVRLTHQPPLPPGNTPGTFLLEAKSTPGP
jgi:hypothetical protein